MRTLEYKVVESNKTNLLGVVYSEGGHVIYTPAPMHMKVEYDNGYFNVRGRFCTYDHVKWSSERKLSSQEFSILYKKLGCSPEEFDTEVRKLRRKDVTKFELIKSLTLTYIKEHHVDPNDLDACYRLALQRENKSKGVASS